MSAWPNLDYPAWAETLRAVHLQTQVVGKVRLAQTPWLNHSWQSPLYVSARGLTTGPIPHGDRLFEIDFDWADSALVIRTDAAQGGFDLTSMSTAQFHERTLAELDRLGVPVSIHGAPNELPDAIPFAEDTAPRPYDADAVDRFRRALIQADRVMKLFRTGFLGKASPVHFFWGSFDLAVTRFSGRPAPRHPGGVPNLPDDVTREAYSHEVSSAGFWPGGPGAETPIFYSYAYPEPPGFRDTQVAGARFDPAFGEFMLPYDAVRTAADPDAALLDFLQATYAAAADCAEWDRAALECELGRIGAPRPVP